MAESTSTLIVAPSGRLRDSLRIMVKAVRHAEQVIQADDGQMALAMVARHAPGLVLLDAALPDGGAWSFLDELRQRFPTVACAVLVYSQADEARSRAGGAETILPVGFSVEAIAGTFSLALKYGHPPPETRARADSLPERPAK